VSERKEKDKVLDVARTGNAYAIVQALNRYLKNALIKMHQVRRRLLAVKYYEAPAFNEIAVELVLVNGLVLKVTMSYDRESGKIEHGWLSVSSLHTCACCE